MIKTIYIRSWEKGLYFKNGEFKGLLGRGRHWIIDPLGRTRVEALSMRRPWLEHDQLDLIVKSGALGSHARVLDLKDSQRALVWIEGRFDRILGPGRHALWQGFKSAEIEILDTREVRFTHGAAHRISEWEGVGRFLHIVDVADGWTCVYTRNGKYVESLSPGRHLFWKGAAQLRFYPVDMRERIMDISGQEIMTADKVSLRINALAGFCIIDAWKSVASSEDTVQALYREAQLALRTAISARNLDGVLNEKAQLAGGLISALEKKAPALGVRINRFGIRDIILPGDMKELMNKVIEAEKAADANLIMRREETAAMRSQANTARLLDNNPTLMRLKELDILEKIVSNSKMNLVLGEKGLGDRIINLL
ncbi:MAG: slipin family protein [Desulfobacter sp.]|nr:MAG: slipin family protein [Desulfobacter sp.]